MFSRGSHLFCVCCPGRDTNVLITGGANTHSSESLSGAGTDIGRWRIRLIARIMIKRGKWDIAIT